MITNSFISYRRKASMHLARNIFIELNQRGINSFLDVENIDAALFDTFIMNQVAARPHYILVLSTGSLIRCVETGDLLLREMQQAVKLNRNIIPVWDFGFDWESEKHYLPQELHFIGNLNAIKVSDEYHTAFIEKIIRFIRNPQEKGEIVVNPAPKSEAELAENTIRKVLETRKDYTAVIDLIVTYDRLQKFAKTSKEWEEVLQLGTEIRSAKNIPDFLRDKLNTEEKTFRKNIEELKKIEETQAKLESDYDFIYDLSQRQDVSKSDVFDMLKRFWKQYPGSQNYDPKDVTGQRKKELDSLPHLSVYNPLSWAQLTLLAVFNTKNFQLFHKHRRQTFDAISDMVLFHALAIASVIMVIGIYIGTLPTHHIEADEFKKILLNIFKLTPLWLVLTYLYASAIFRFRDRNGNRVTKALLFVPPMFWFIMFTIPVIIIVSVNATALLISCLCMVVGFCFMSINNVNSDTFLGNAVTVILIIAFLIGSLSDINGLFFVGIPLITHFSLTVSKSMLYDISTRSLARIIWMLAILLIYAFIAWVSFSFFPNHVMNLT